MFSDRSRRVRARRAHPTGPTDAPAENEDIGQAVGRTWGCSTGRFKPKRIKIAPAVKELLIRNEFVFQSLNWGLGTNVYRSKGTLPLYTQYTLGSATTWPRAMAFPVYVFRLSTPGSGKQFSYITTNDRTACPMIAYRLQGFQDYDNEVWKYTWVRTAVDIPILNNIPDPEVPYVSTQANHAAGVMVEKMFDATQKICHEMSDIQVLFTAPTHTSVDVEMSIIKFMDSKWAPPDEYTDYTSDPPVDRIVQPNIQDISAADSHTFADRITPWLASRMSHPCFQPIYGRGLTETKFWVEDSKFAKTMTNGLTINKDSYGCQYKHRHMMRPNVWHATNCEPDRYPTVDGPGFITVNPSKIDDHSGLFPASDKQRWVMVSGFTRNFIRLVDHVYDTQQDPSFDISIRSKFAASAA